MAGYDQIIGTADVTDALIPEQAIKEILQATPEDSVMLTRARKVAMSSKKTKQPVLASLPEAYFVDAEAPGLKQTTDVSWKGLTMVAEEIAAIVPIPDALVDDSNVPLWDEVKPLVREAIGKTLDAACIFGVNKPSTWPEALVPAAIAAGNVAQIGAANPNGGTYNIADAFLAVAQKASEGGFAPNGFVTQPGLNWQLRGLKDGQGQYLFGAPTQGGDATLQPVVRAAPRRRPAPHPAPDGYPAGQWGWWTVDPGHTMWGMATASGVSLDYLQAMNPQVEDGASIRPGQRLRVGQ